MRAVEDRERAGAAWSGGWVGRKESRLSEAGPTGAEDWATAAQDYLGAARTLARARRWRSAYQEAGFALECALKSRIMREHRMNRWPTRPDRPDLYTHDPDILLQHAGLAVRMAAEVAAATAIGTAWMVAKDFSINRRYPDGRPFPIKLGRDMVRALNDQGLLAWLLTNRS